MEPDRTFRVFISSTFRDMQSERDYLVKFTFPRLRKLCEARRVTWGEVDLRWGIPDEDKDSVLPLCLREIDMSRPYFIGLLGERYGYVPTTIDDDLLDGLPWLGAHLGKSITEIEMLHGALNDPGTSSSAYFYFRDPAGPALTSGQARVDFAADSGENAAKLQRLKAAIADTANGAPDSCHLRTAFRTPEQLGQWILEDFTQLIDRLFPASEVPNETERERQEHEAYVRNHGRAYVAHKEYFERLDEHISGSGSVLVVVGEPGAGKSALLANWYSRHRALHPTDFMLIHFVGGATDSTNPTHILRRIMLELKSRFPGIVTGEVPDDPDHLPQEFSKWLVGLAESGPIILVLDGIDQLDTIEGSSALGWLPAAFPPNCRVVVSTRPGTVLDATRLRQWTELPIAPLTASEKTVLIREFLALFRRRLGPDHVAQIVAADVTANPLFLRGMLDELRQFGEHERLGERIAHYLSARTPNDLYDIIVERWERDYGADLVRRGLGFIGASRHGLSEAELLDLLGDGAPLPHSKWVPLHLAAEASLIRRSGHLTFAHGFIRSAVESRAVPGPLEQRRAHGELADYFARSGELNDRIVEELPWQLCEAGRHGALASLLVRLDAFRAIVGRGYLELLGYWRRVAPRYEVVACYEAAWKTWNDTTLTPIARGKIAYDVGYFLRRSGYFEACKVFYERAEADLAADPANIPLLDELARVYLQLEQLDKGEEILLALVRIARETGYEHSRSTLTRLSDLSLVLAHRGKFADAEALCRLALEDRRARLGENDADTVGSVGNLALLLMNRGDLDGAATLLREVIVKRQDALGAEHPVTVAAIDNLAMVLCEKRDFTEAEALNKHALEGFEKHLGASHPETLGCAVNHGIILVGRADFATAVAHIRDALPHLRAIFPDGHPTTLRALSNLAIALDGNGDWPEAEALYRELLDAKDSVPGSQHLIATTAARNLAAFLDARGRPAEAVQAYRRALVGFRTFLGEGHPKTIDTFDNLVRLLLRLGDDAGLIALYREILPARTEFLGVEHKHTLFVVVKLSELLIEQGDYAEAIPVLRRLLAAKERISGKDKPGTVQTAYDLARSLAATEAKAEAEALFRYVLKMRTLLLGRDATQTLFSANALGYLLYDVGRFGESEAVLASACDESRRTHGAENPVTAALRQNLFCCLREQGKLDAAWRLVR
jgi:tetratricopeptide (TPR) repeat protein